MSGAIHILHVLGGVNLGGAESRIMDLYRHMDRDRIQFDFLVHTDEKGYYEEEIARLGGKIFRIPRFRLYNFFSYKRAVKAFFAAHSEFQVVQGHMTSTAAVYLPIAKRTGVPVTIAHARSAGVDKGIKGIVTRFMRRNLSQKADYLFACSGMAALSVFGKSAVEQGKTVFIPNAVETSLFAYNEKKREEMRRKLGLEDNYVIGHVGRFHYAKNHEYLLQVFAQLCEYGQSTPGQQGESVPDYTLILIGEGGGMDAVKRFAEELGIRDRVHFLGNRSHIYDYYQAMDYFVYPSRYEGLPGAVIEAQTAGLRCLMSDSICNEAVVTDLVHAMSISDSPDKWAEYIRKTGNYERRSHAGEVERAGFDVTGQAQAMTKFYETGKW